jgi:fructose-bisphosphate aldolase class I|tara:strand:- start:17 stop:1000 length:984 start_codon:yes stop_codon:yes gene_type:complete
MSELHAVAHKMVEKGKGILAADESIPTCLKRFESIGTESTAESRNVYRNMLLTSENIEKYISGVILFDETFYQNELSTGLTFPEYLTSKNILPGIKVDQGLEDYGSNEKITKGIDGLSERLGKYYALGARFAKWRAVITIGDGLPSDECILENAKALAKYALKCQQANLVPIVEPEVLMNGSHTIDESFEATAKALNTTFDQLIELNVNLQGIVLKPNMILSGYECSYQASIEEVAEKTINCLTANVPSEVPGIAFLSGGQPDEDATLHLNEMNKYDNDWNLTFSYGRALQQPALKAWSGKSENLKLGQQAFIERAKANSLASVAGL